MLGIVLALLSGLAGAAQDRVVQGRWTIEGMPMSYNFVGDTVEFLMYPPQAPAMSYRVRGDSITTESAGQRLTGAFSVHGDTLTLALGGPPRRYVRLATPSAEANGIEGTWRAVAGQQIGIMTFRSDGQFIMEVGLPNQGRLFGDTLELSAGGRNVRSLLQLKGATLTLRPLDQRPPQKLVQRPWGCFGLKALDGKARECK